MQSLAYSIRKSLSHIFKDVRSTFTPNAAFQPGFIAWHNVAAAIFLRASVGKAAARVTPYSPLSLCIQRNGKPSVIPLFDTFGIIPALPSFHTSRN